MSRSLVGSSITSTFDGLVNSRASSSRLRSPPESRDTGPGGLLGREEEIFQVADDVPPPAVDLDRVGAVADVVAHRFRVVQLGVELVEVGHVEIRAVADASRSAAATGPAAGATGSSCPSRSGRSGRPGRRA